MSVKLVLGVVNIPYGHAYGEDTVDPNITTADVAKKLEKRYQIMQSFYKAHESEIKQGYATAIGNMLMGAMVHGRPLQINQALNQATKSIPKKFHDFLDNREMDGLADGVPTKRSLKGITHRRKKRKISVGTRPSFEDSLLYRNSMKAWTNNDG
jgi:hypothetical protein